MSGQTPSLWDGAKAPTVPPKPEQKPADRTVAAKSDPSKSGAGGGLAAGIVLLPVVAIGLVFLYTVSPVAAIILGIVVLLALVAGGAWRWIALLMLGRAASRGRNSTRSTTTGGSGSRPSGGSPAGRPLGPGRTPGTAPSGGRPTGGQRPSRTPWWSRSPRGTNDGSRGGSPGRTPTGRRPSRSPGPPAGSPNIPAGVRPSSQKPADRDRPGRWPWSKQRPGVGDNPGGGGDRSRGPNGGKPPGNRSPSGGSPSGGGSRSPWWKPSPRRSGNDGAGGGRPPGGRANRPSGSDSSGDSKRRQPGSGGPARPSRRNNGTGECIRPGSNPLRRQRKADKADDEGSPAPDQATPAPVDSSGGTRRRTLARLLGGRSDTQWMTVWDDPDRKPIGERIRERRVSRRGKGATSAEGAAQSNIEPIPWDHERKRGSSAEAGLLAEADWHPGNRNASAPDDSAVRAASTSSPGRRMIDDEAALMGGADPHDDASAVTPAARQVELNSERNRKVSQDSGNGVSVSPREDAAAYDANSERARSGASRAQNRSIELHADVRNSEQAGVPAPELRRRAVKWGLLAETRQRIAAHAANKASNAGR